MVLIYWGRLNVLVSLLINNLGGRRPSLRERSSSTLVMLPNWVSWNEAIWSSVGTHIRIAVSIWIICWTVLELFILKMSTRDRRGTMKDKNFLFRKKLFFYFKLIRFRFLFDGRRKFCITIIRATRCLSWFLRCFEFIQDLRFPLIIKPFIQEMRT